MISWMQSLSDLTRTRLLRLLDGHELTVMELCTVLQLPQSTVSRHLKTLADDGWITSRRDGTSNLYALQLRDLEDSRKRLWAFVREQTQGDLLSAQDDSRLQHVLSDRASRNENFFTSAATKWDRLRTDLFGLRLDAWSMAALLPKEWVIADLGCGTGTLLQALAQQVHRVIGIDSSPSMLDAAQRRLSNYENVELMTGDLSDLPLPNETLDAAILSIVLPYVAAPIDVLAEAARVSKRAARLVIIDLLPHDRTEFRQELSHSWLGFSRLQLNDWLTDAGWRLDTFVELPPQAEAKGPNLFLCTAERV